MAMPVPGTSAVLGEGAEEQKGETARLVISLPCYRMSDRDSALLCRRVINNSAFPISTAASLSNALVRQRRLIVLLLLQASFVGAMAIADLVKTTLGPKGMVSLRLLAAECRSCVLWFGI